MPRTVTLKDVAKIAGVSTATVARVLHDNGHVRAETRLRVERALDDAGYRLNVVAQGLRTRRSSMIGHLLHSITENPFFAEVALGLEEEALHNGYNVFIYNVQGQAEREREGVETFLARRVDAIVFTTAMDKSNVSMAARAGIPVVQIERMTPVETNAVTVDHYTGAREAMEHLLELGHERIAFIGGDPRWYPYLTPRKRTVEEERLAAYHDALSDRGLGIDEELVHLGRYFSLEEPGSGIEGRTRMRQLLSLAARPTAVFATCDVLAAGVLQALYEARLWVPDDISVIGFDDTYADHLSPRLTTVALPSRDIGSAAAKLAMDALTSSRTTGGNCVQELRSSLTVRESTGPAKLYR